MINISCSSKSQSPSVYACPKIMSCSSAAPLSKHFSVVETSLTSLPTTLVTKTQSPSRKPIKLSLSAAFPSWASLQAHNKFSSLHIIPLVAQTSDWAQQGEEENQSWENQEIVGSVDGEERFGGGSEENYIEPPEDAKLFVGNLPHDFDSERLAQLFNRAGVVEISEDVNGRLLTVNMAAPRGSRPERPQVYESSYRIYVGNLPWQVDDARLEQVFSKHGKVVNARVVCDRETGRSRGFGFVTMSSGAELNDAIAALDGQNLDGRAIRVNVAEERSR